MTELAEEPTEVASEGVAIGKIECNEHALEVGALWMMLQSRGVDIIPLLDNGDITNDFLVMLPGLFPGAEPQEVYVRVVWAEAL